MTLKMRKINRLTTILFLLAGLVWSCNKEKEDTTPPGKLTIKEVIATHGGAKIAYDLPNDNDILYVKAKYTTTIGEDVFKASSLYKDTVELDGFNDTTPQKVELYVVDRSNNESEPVITEVKPLISYIHLVQESIQVTPGFGSVSVSWENVSEKKVHVKLYFEHEQGTDSVILSQSRRHFSTTFRGLDSVNYRVSSIVTDEHENQTNLTEIGTVKPRFEEKIEKSTWSLVSSLSVDGNAWEGLTENFWDDVIDTRENPDDNSYFIINRDDNGGMFNYPMDIVIDLNKQVIMNRFIVWQRDFSYPGNDDNTSDESYYYQVENMRSFNIYVSNNLEEWTLAGEFDIGDPKDEDGNIPQEYIELAREGHDFILEQNTEPFRYLKFSITANYGSETNIYGSELTIYGVDNYEQ